MQPAESFPGNEAAIGEGGEAPDFGVGFQTGDLLVGFQAHSEFGRRYPWLGVVAAGLAARRGHRATRSCFRGTPITTLFSTPAMTLKDGNHASRFMP